MSVTVRPFPMISYINVKSREKRRLESRLLTAFTFTFKTVFTYECIKRYHYQHRPCVRYRIIYFAVAVFAVAVFAVAVFALLVSFLVLLIFPNHQYALVSRKVSVNNHNRLPPQAGYKQACYYCNSPSIVL